MLESGVGEEWMNLKWNQMAGKIHGQTTFIETNSYRKRLKTLEKMEPDEGEKRYDRYRRHCGSVDC